MNLYKHIKRGREHPSWRGGTIKRSDGRYYILMPCHYKSNGRGYVRKCVLVAEKVLGKTFPENAIVHHIDRNKGNDNNTNLVLCEDDNYHKLLHRRERSYKACGHANYRKCWICEEYDSVDNLYIPPNEATGSIRHRKCMYEYNKALLAS